MEANKKDNGFEQWCLLDLFGHVRLAGRVTEATIGGCSFLRCDVPEGEGYRTEYYGNGAIYSLRPVSEEIARAFVESHQTAPVSPYEVSSLLKRIGPPPDIAEEGRNAMINNDDDDVY